MSPSDAEYLASFAQVRRLEAVSFRAWPSAITHYDGTWVIRLNAGHPSKRINSVNPLDRGDDRNIENRVERAAQRFQSFGRQLIFRQTPLMPLSLIKLLDSRNWPNVDESVVMTADLDQLDLSAAVNQLPFQDVGHWVDNALSLRNRPDHHKPGLSELIDFIKPEKGLFLLESEDSKPLATTLCVHDKDMAGVFELATAVEKRRLGYGKQILATALNWVQQQGAKTAWLQVEADNSAALNLYRSMGFDEVYRYVYRVAPQDVAPPEAEL